VFLAVTSPANFFHSPVLPFPCGFPVRLARSCHVPPTLFIHSPSADHAICFETFHLTPFQEPFSKPCCFACRLYRPPATGRPFDRWAAPCAYPFCSTPAPFPPPAPLLFAPFWTRPKRGLPTRPPNHHPLSAYPLSSFFFVYLVVLTSAQQARVILYPSCFPRY